MMTPRRQRPPFPGTGDGAVVGGRGAPGRKPRPAEGSVFGVGVVSTRAASLDPEFQGAGETGPSSKLSLIEHRLNTGSGPSEQPAVWLAKGHCHGAAEFPRVPGPEAGAAGFIGRSLGLCGWEVTPSPPPPLSSLNGWDGGCRRKPPAPIPQLIPWLLSEVCSGTLTGSLVSSGVEPVLIGSAWGHLIGCPGAYHI